MKDKDKIVIQKIIVYIDDVKEYINNVDAITFLTDKKTLTACAFSVSQIGEITKQISDDVLKKYPNIPWTSMKGMRNRIVHDYENVNLTVLWRTIKESLPELKEQLLNVLNEDD